MSERDRPEQAIVLLANVSGLTALSEKLDPEEVPEVLHQPWSRPDLVILRLSTSTSATE